MGSAKSPPASHHTSGSKPPPRIRGRQKLSISFEMLFSFYSLEMAVIQSGLSPEFGFLTDTFLAPVKMESNCNTARVER